MAFFRTVSSSEALPVISGEGVILRAPQMADFAEWSALRELSRDGRIFKIAVSIEDLPGQLSRVARAIGDARGSILEVQHSRLSLDISAKQTDLECLIEARDREHGNEICAAIEKLGIPVRRLS